MVKALSGIFQDGQNYRISKKCPCVHISVNSQNRQWTGCDLNSNFPLMYIVQQLVARLTMLKQYMSQIDCKKSRLLEVPE